MAKRNGKKSKAVATRRGRKGLYSPEITEEICKILAAGCTDKDAYEYVGLNHDSFYKWLNKHAEFAEAVKRAKTKARVAVTNKLVELINDKNLGAIVWWQKNRDPENWKDSPEVVVQSNTQVNVVANGEKASLPI